MARQTAHDKTSHCGWRHQMTLHSSLLSHALAAPLSLFFLHPRATGKMCGRCGSRAAAA
jgi:hypothetical protein